MAAIPSALDNELRPQNQQLPQHKFSVIIYLYMDINNYNTDDCAKKFMRKPSLPLARKIYKVL